MSERERWVVYPLLFLALGAALRDKLVDSTTTRRIVCEELTVIDEQPVGQEPVLIAKIGRTESTSGTTGGYLVVNGQLDVEGVVNANHYAYQGVPFVPALQAVLPSISLPDLIQAWQRAAAEAQRAKAAEGKPAPQDAQAPAASAAQPPRETQPQPDAQP